METQPESVTTDRARDLDLVAARRLADEQRIEAAVADRLVGIAGRWEYPNWRSAAPAVLEAAGVPALLDQLEAAQQRINAATKLHYADGYGPGPDYDCMTCGFESGWPCATVAALGAAVNDSSTEAKP